MQIVWHGVKLGKLGRPSADPETYRARSEAKILKWEMLRSHKGAERDCRYSLKNKISAMRHRLKNKDFKADKQNQDFQVKVYNLRLVLKILIEMPLSLNRA